MNTQKLVNHFPSWTIIRRDESSLGQRLLSSYSELLENESFDILKEVEEKNLYTKSLLNGDLYRIDLIEEEYIVATRSFGLPTYTYHTEIVGEENSVVYTLERQETIEDFIYGIPTRLSLYESVSVTDWLLWNNAGTENDLDTIQTLLIKVSNATEFRINPSIYIRGKDQNYYPCAETISLKDIGEYGTKNAFSIINEISTTGISADISIYAGRKNQTYVEDKRRKLVTDLAEGSFKIRSTDDSLEYYFSVFNQGSEYIGSIEGEVEIEEQVCIQDLLDETNTLYTPIDIAIGPHDGRLYTIDDDNIVHIHELDFNNFVSTYTQPSDYIYIEILPIKRRVKMNETISFWTFHRVLRLLIDEIRISRFDPSGNIEYLQSDKATWSTSEYWFPGTGYSSLLPEDSWADFQFSSSFDEYGQWEFVCDVKFISSTETSTFVTCIFCESNTSLKDIDTNLVGVENIWFDHENYLVCATNSVLHRFDLRWDYYYADPINQKIYLKHLYDYTEVVV